MNKLKTSLHEKHFYLILSTSSKFLLKFLTRSLVLRHSAVLRLLHTAESRRRHMTV
jgi:hypothetical protein